MSVDFVNPAVWAEGYLTESEEASRLRVTAEMIPRDVLSLLDIGAANGGFLRIVEELRPSMSLAGIEMSAAAIDCKICTSIITEGSAEKLPYEGCQFDVVTVLEVIEHLPCGVFERSLAEIERVASRNIIVSAPFQEARGKVRCPYCSTDFHPWGHLRSFDENQMAVLIPKFRMVGLRKINALRRVGVFNPLRVIRRLRGDVPFMPPLVICPACRFTRPPSDVRAGESNLKVNDFLRRMLPQRLVPTWVVCLYSRVNR